jgi:uncharacterized membrane-anchored protein
MPHTTQSRRFRLVRKVKASYFRILAIASVLPACLYGQSTTAISDINWEHGATRARLGTQAEIFVPEGFRFADSTGARQFIELNQDIPTGRELGVLARDDFKWFVIFEFTEDGYVKDDEKDSFDAAAILNEIQVATNQANIEKQKRGWGTMTVLDWIEPPHYALATHNLEWSIRGQDEKGEFVANHNTRYLGRRGVMSVTVVAETNELAAALPEFRDAMRGFTYTPENDYRAFVKGDKVAEYGLTALVVGGAAAAAAKGGFLKGLWKLIVAGFVGLAGIVKKLLSPEKEPSNQSS